MYKIQKISIDGKDYNLGYRVTTLDMKSLGFKNNPYIHQYPMNEWYFLPEENLVPGEDDWGGIWVARTMSKGKGTVYDAYRRKTNPMKTRFFKALFDEVLYVNSYRIKTNGICIIEEIDVTDIFEKIDSKHSNTI